MQPVDITTAWLRGWRKELPRWVVEFYTREEVSRRLLNRSMRAGGGWKGDDRDGADLEFLCAERQVLTRLDHRPDFGEGLDRDTRSEMSRS